jgi:ABC-type transporter Mla subunit MlaD
MRRALRHSAQRAERHPLALGLFSLAVIAAITYVGFQALNGVPFQSPYRLAALLPPDSPPLKSGDMVRIAGQRVGQIRQVSVGNGGLLIHMTLSPSDGPVGRDATAGVRERAVGGVYYVEITRGDFQHAPMPNGFTIPRTQTSAAGDLLPIIAQFDRSFRNAMARTTSVFGTGLTGRGGQLNVALADLPVATAQGTPELQAAIPHPGALTELFREVRRTAEGFAAPSGGQNLANLVTAARGAFEAFAQSRGNLQLTLDLLRPFEDQALQTLPIATPVLSDASAMAAELRPGVHALNLALPDLNALLQTGGTLDDEVHRLTKIAAPVLRAGIPLLSKLAIPAELLALAVGPLGPIASQIAPYYREAFVFGDAAIRATNVVDPGGIEYNKNDHLQRVNFVFTCALARDPYPAVGQAHTDRKACAP